MRILIVSYFYKPHVSARAFRWGALAERWVRQGHAVDVIASPEGSDILHETLNGVGVYRVESPLMRRLLAAQSGVVSPPTVEQRPSPVGWLLEWGYRNMWRRFMWPDAAFLWIRPAVRQGQALMGAHRYDVVITVSPFFSAHLVGERIRPSGLRWIMDYGDPFSLHLDDAHNNTTLYERRNYHVERRLLARADRASVTTELTAIMYCEAFPAAAGKVHVIPPLAPKAPEGSFSAGADSVLRMLYAGSFYPAIRRPDFLLRLFAAAAETLPKRLELHIYGDVSRVQSAFTPYAAHIEAGQLVLHGTAPRQRVRQAMCLSDVLVNIGNTTAYQLPSKVVEYASTGQPILNLAAIQDDSSSRVLATYPNALTLHQIETFAANQERLQTWLRALPEPLSEREISRWIRPYRLEAVGAAYDRLIEAG